MLLLLLFFGVNIAALYTDWLWFGEVNYRGVFGRIVGTRLLLFLVFGAASFALAYGNLRLAERFSPPVGIRVPGEGPEGGDVFIFDWKALRRATVDGRVVTTSPSCAASWPSRSGWGRWRSPCSRAFGGGAVGQLPALRQPDGLRRAGPAVRQGHRLLRVGCCRSCTSCRGGCWSCCSSSGRRSRSCTSSSGASIRRPGAPMSRRTCGPTCRRSIAWVFCSRSRSATGSTASTSAVCRRRSFRRLHRRTPAAWPQPAGRRRRPGRDRAGQHLAALPAPARRGARPVAGRFLLGALVPGGIQATVVRPHRGHAASAGDRACDRATARRARSGEGGPARLPGSAGVDGG